MPEKQLIIYTDGASRGNPGPGGYGALLQWGNKRKELSAGYKRTTNNRMELMAVIAALEALTKKDIPIKIYTDSKYVYNSVEKGWLWNWQRKGFKGKKNVDLWRRFIPLYRKHQIKFYWVKGHAENPWNNRCDELATRAADETPFLTDEGFEKER